MGHREGRNGRPLRNHGGESGDQPDTAPYQWFVSWWVPTKFELQAERPQRRSGIPLPSVGPASSESTALRTARFASSKPVVPAPPIFDRFRLRKEISSSIRSVCVGQVLGTVLSVRQLCRQFELSIVQPDWCMCSGRLRGFIATEAPRFGSLDHYSRTLESGSPNLGGKRTSSVFECLREMRRSQSYAGRTIGQGRFGGNGRIRGGRCNGAERHSDSDAPRRLSNGEGYFASAPSAGSTEQGLTATIED